MKTIYKFPFQIADYVVIEVPKGTEFLHVDHQHGDFCLWGLVDTEAPPIRRQIRVIGTGHSADDISAGKYIGSLLTLNGTYVWHIFDVGDIFQ